MKLKAIVFITKNGAISNENLIPWSNPQDLKHFKETTLGCPIIMGRKTFETLPKKGLGGRLNIIITRQKLTSDNYNVIFCSFEECKIIMNKYHIGYLIGGKEIYSLFDSNNLIDEYIITHLNESQKADTFITFHNNYKIDEIKPLKENINVLYCSKAERHPEYQYLELVRNILENGSDKLDRTNVGTKSLFNCSMKYDLRDGFPLMTTKFVSFKNILTETLWFISGNTNSKLLEAQGNNIWKGNTSRQFLDSRNLEYPEGDIGPAYGFQWRHFGSEYSTCNESYENKGIDQLKSVIDLINNNPDSRRICMTGWNPIDLDKMVLPPCHSCFVQFYCSGEYLDLVMYQRSADLGLAFGSYNVGNYAILLSIIANLTNRIPRYLSMIGGDVHIYNNHIEPLKIQLERKPFIYPKLIIKRKLNNIDDIKFEDFQLIGYTYHPSIKMEMAI